MVYELGECEFYCGRPATIETGWGNRFCYGHLIVGQANADSHGEYGISVEEYRERLLKAKEWFKENPVDK